ncbi:MAG: solute carrier family 23 protein [Hyphomicrobiales bacterium]
MTDAAAHTSLDRVVRPPGLIYGVDEWPPPLQLAITGFQYAVVSSIYLVLVAIIVRHSNADAETSLKVMRIACFGLAIGTALQALPRGPVGSGFLAPPVFSAVYLAPSLLAAESGGMPLVFGMTLFAGAVEVVFGLLLHRLRLLITPILSGLTVLIVGLQLGLVGIGELLDVKDEHQTFFAHHLMVTTMTLAISIYLSIWGRGVWKMTCSLLGLIVGMIGAYLVGIIGAPNLATLSDAPWFAVPVPLLFDLKFDVSLVPAFLAAGIAGALRSVGVLTTCQRLNNAAWQRPDAGNLKRGVLADGLANVIGGCIGVTGMCSAPSLVGISGATGATSRVIAYAAAAFLVVFAASPKLSGFFLTVPTEVAGPLLVFTACFMIAGGMEITVSRPLGTRGTYVVGIAILLALGQDMFTDYFNALPAIVKSFTGSMLAVGLIAAIVLSLLFRFGARQRKSLPWSSALDTLSGAVDGLRAQTKIWSIPSGIADLAVSEAREVMEFVRDNHMLKPDATLETSYDGISLQARVIYQGTEAAKLPPLRSVHLSEAVELGNEEEAAFAGLRHFLHHMAADRKEIDAKDGQVVIRLTYTL